MGSVDWQKLPFRKFRSGGMYYLLPEGGDSTQSPVANTMYSVPLDLWQSTLDIDLIGIEVITSEAGTTLRLGVWEDEQTEGGFPGKLILDAGVTGMAGTSTGRKDNTLATPLRLRGPARYHFSLCVQGGAGLLEVKMTSGYTPGAAGKYSDLVNLFGGGYKAESTTLGALPTTFPTPPSSSRMPKIYIRTK